MVQRPLIFSLSKTNRRNIFQLTVLSWLGWVGASAPFGRLGFIWCCCSNFTILWHSPHLSGMCCLCMSVCVCIIIWMCIYSTGLYKAVLILSGTNAVNILPWYLFQQQTSDLCCPFLKGESFADPSLLSPHLLTASCKAGVTEAGVLRGTVRSHNTGKDLEVATNNEKTKRDEWQWQQIVLSCVH